MRILKPHEVIDRASNWFRVAKNAGETPFWIVLAIALYMPFEEFILKWLPLPDFGIGLLRFLPEIILYGLVVNVFWKKILNRDPLKSTPIDILLILFFISSGISVVINQSGLFPTLENLRALWRYLSVFYILVNIEISISQLTLVLKCIRTVGLIQALLATAQFFMPASLQQVFVPKKFTLGDYERVSAAETGEIKSGAVFGMFDHPAVLAAFLLITVLLTISSLYKIPEGFSINFKDIASLAALLFGIFATKKRASLLFALLIPMGFLYFQKKIRTLLKLGWAYSALLFSVVVLIAFLGSTVDTSFTSTDERAGSIDLTSYFAQIFSPDYYEQSSEHSRGWVIKTTATTLIKSGSWFGFGPDLENMRHIIFNLLTDGVDRAKIFALGPFEDVYWVAMLAYYGPIGLGIYACIFLRLFQAGRSLSKFSPHPAYRSLGSIFCTLLILTIIFNFISRTIKFRVFSFVFWLFAGLVVNAYNQQSNKKSILLCFPHNSKTLNS